MMDKTLDKTLDKEKMYACWLDAICGLGRKAKHTLLKEAGSASGIYHMVQTSSEQSLRALIGEKSYGRLRQEQKETTPQGVWEQMDKRGIRYTFCGAPDFPQKLREIPDVPFGIFYKGALPRVETPSVAVIGARKCSEYGRYMAESIAAGLAARGVGIISGMAMGIDGISQRAALKAGGASYGVLGCGVDVAYPSSNVELYHQLIENGGVLSEYPPAMKPRPALFPPRNRIISAFSDAVLVVEAREKSGTFITVDMALEQGREVYAVPGRCTDGLSRGCNQLLRQGAAAACSAEDLINDMGWNRILDKKRDMINNTVNDMATHTANSTAALSRTAQEIYGVLDVLPMSPDVIAALLAQNGCRADRSQICQGLLELELTNEAVRTCGGYQLAP